MNVRDEAQRGKTIYSPGAELGPYAFWEWIFFFDRKLDYNLGFKTKVGRLL